MPKTVVPRHWLPNREAAIRIREIFIAHGWELNFDPATLLAENRRSPELKGKPRGNRKELGFLPFARSGIHVYYDPQALEKWVVGGFAEPTEPKLH